MSTTGKRWAQLGAPLCIRLSAEEAAALRKLAASEGKPVAVIVREAIRTRLALIPDGARTEVQP